MFHNICAINTEVNVVMGSFLVKVWNAQSWIFGKSF
jgi:hypothetical protein